MEADHKQVLQRISASTLGNDRADTDSNASFTLVSVASFSPCAQKTALLYETFPATAVV